jgi:hypothetical protein
MKKLFTILAVALLMANVFAQVPNKMSYQAVVRNATNALVANTTVGMRVSILQNSAGGNAVYVETQTPTSNNNGLISIEIGGGTIVSGNFATIDWANGSYFIKTEIDLAGGFNYSITGTSQLLSVPYAKYAATSGSSTPGPQGPTGSQGPAGANGANGKKTLVKTTVEATGTNCATGGMKLEYGLDVNNNDTLDSGEINPSLTNYICNGVTGSQGHVGSGGFAHSIGEQFGGGVIFHLWKDTSNIEHGLIAATTDIGTSQVWSNIISEIGTSSQNKWNGSSNSNAIVGQAGHTTSAAKACLDLVSGGQTDWYLPSIDELVLLWDAHYDVDKTLSTIIGAMSLSFGNSYWSSTESSYFNAWGLNFATSIPISTNKNTIVNIRAIRSF